MGTSKLAPTAKRSYNLKPATIALVKHIAERNLTPQDAVVERAIHKLARSIQDEIDAQLWADAGKDPILMAEVRQIEREFPLTGAAWGA